MLMQKYAVSLKRRLPVWMAQFFGSGLCWNAIGISNEMNMREQVVHVGKAIGNRYKRNRWNRLIYNGIAWPPLCFQLLRMIGSPGGYIYRTSTATKKTNASEFMQLNRKPEMCIGLRVPAKKFFPKMIVRMGESCERIYTNIYAAEMGGA